MYGGEEIQITPEMQRYIDRNDAYLAKRGRYIRDVVKKWKFDTIAVHGLYSVDAQYLALHVFLQHRKSRTSHARENQRHVNITVIIEFNFAQHAHFSQRHVDMRIEHTPDSRFDLVTRCYQSWSPHSSRRSRS